MFIPFRVQEIYHKDGVYYGQNVISKNMIIANRRHLLNGNSFILGVSGAGKSFTAKEEMTNIILTDPNADVIIIDPEREYPLHSTDDRHSYPSAGRHGGTGVRDFSAVGACGAATRRLALHDRY